MILKLSPRLILVVSSNTLGVCWLFRVDLSAWMLDYLFVTFVCDRRRYRSNKINKCKKLSVVIILTKPHIVSYLFKFIDREKFDFYKK